MASERNSTQLNSLFNPTAYSVAASVPGPIAPRICEQSGKVSHHNDNAAPPFRIIRLVPFRWVTGRV